MAAAGSAAVVAAAAAAPRRLPRDGEACRVVTTNMTGGYLLSSRAAYSENAVLTEHFTRHADFGVEYFTVTAVVEDGGANRITSSTFKKEADGSKFSPVGLRRRPIAERSFPVMEFFQWLEQTSLSVWVREAPTVWAYPSVLLLHTIGMALCVGIAAGIDLRILGFAPGVRLAPLETFFPILWAGFGINAVTGTVLLMQDASTKLMNPDFYVKMVFIALAIVTLRMIRASRVPLIHGSMRGRSRPTSRCWRPRRFSAGSGRSPRVACSRTSVR